MFCSGSRQGLVYGCRRHFYLPFSFCLHYFAFLILHLFFTGLMAMDIGQDSMCLLFCAGHMPRFGFAYTGECRDLISFVPQICGAHEVCMCQPVLFTSRHFGGYVWITLTLYDIWFRWNVMENL